MGQIEVDGHLIEITHPYKIIWQNQGITKMDYIQYLLDVSSYLIQHAKERLLMIWVYPHGISGKKIEKRSLPETAPQWVCHTFYKGKERILLNDRATLVWAANYGAIEFHVPFDRHDKTDYPLEMVFDLDPPEDNSFNLVLEVAIKLKQLLESLGLASVPRTSGSLGMQVFIPIQPNYTFEQTRKINTFVAQYFAEQMPQHVTLERIVSRRGTKLYFDYLQLWRGRTMPVVYSARAKSEPTVAAPLTWEEVEAGIRPTDFTILNMQQRIQVMGDLFNPVTSEKRNQSLDDILKFIERNKV
ncbi:bifunctional non-homologous end joining protein LigD [Neobacillus niacini]|uniref:non-homologous end-joining DNA ligase n=1 Tax=Neobacillus niacini TaxID=86668 RepID=UPI00277E76D4|nr:non-homologous end-joining DNA ligase [Neobacillus niacini]MDQ1003356.1 bifunctional non-homologous end joining protein LigD [Neobacillus niacini]